MKKRYFLKVFSLILIASMLSFNLQAQCVGNVNIPDAQLKTALINHYPLIDINNDGEIQCAEAESFTGDINVIGKNIEVATGLEAFINIAKLYITDNKLETLDVSSNTALTLLYCDRNNLKQLDVSKNTDLTSLSCSYNQLTQLDVSSNTALNHLICYLNLLTQLDVSKNTDLATLNCGDNLLTQLDVSKNTALTILHCNKNQLAQLDVSKNTDLTSLSCSYNQLTQLGVSVNTALINLSCEHNKLAQLDLSKNTDLTTLSCSYNQLTQLGVSENTALIHFTCEHNKLAQLNVSENTAIVWLECNDNLLTSLNLKNGNNGSIIEMDVVNNPNLTCIQVDDETDATTHNKWIKDATAYYSNSCPEWCTVNIPDANLKTALVTDTLINTNKDAEIQCTEAVAYTGDLNLNNKNISNATGIEAFMNITGLYIQDNKLDTLDVSTNIALINFACDRNQIKQLDVSKNTALTALYCTYNQLTQLDVSKNTDLTILYCSYNQLTQLGVSENTALKDFICEHNKLAQLNVSENTALKKLNCFRNQLSQLDVSENTALTLFDCGDNLLTSLNLKNGNNAAVIYASMTNNPNLTCIQVDDETDNTTHANWTKDVTASYSNDCSPPCVVNIPDANFKAALVADTLINTNKDAEIQCAEAVAYSGKLNLDFTNISNASGLEAFVNITELELNYNKLDTLDLSANTALTSVSCSYNQLKQLDVSKNTALTHLNCSNNQLTQLNLSSNTALTSVYCYGNQLTQLDLSENTALTNVACENNQLTQLNVSKNTALAVFNCGDNLLASLNLKNGNNASVVYAGMTNNPNLTCIQVDDETDNTTHANWTKDVTASYSNDCSPPCVVNIPDANFKAALVADTLINTNKDAEIQCAEAEAFTGKINIYENTAVTDITGVEYFTNLTGLDVGATMITSIAMVNNPKLTTIYFDGTLVQEADLSGLPKLDSILAGFSDNLTKLNVANGNNKNIGLDASGAFNLTCITVDDENDVATHSLWLVDNGVSFSNNCSTVGINELNNINFTLSPNPSNGQFSVALSSVDGSPKLTIANAFGQEVHTINVSSTNQLIDVNHLPTGLYFVNITNNKQEVITKKLIIQ